jgi:hypothetical protein
MLYLIVIWVRSEGVGPLLWPGVVVHSILIVLLVGAWVKTTKESGHIGHIYELNTKSIAKGQI